MASGLEPMVSHQTEPFVGIPVIDQCAIFFILENFHQMQQYVLQIQWG